MSDLESMISLRHATRPDFPDAPTDEMLIEANRSEWERFQSEPPVYSQGELQGLFEIWRGSIGLKEKLMKLSVEEVRQELQRAQELYDQPQTAQMHMDLLMFMQLAHRCLVR